ncbi:AMP-binding protein [Hyphococcus flavus]|uniref:AMP-binding protein n=1 Tax=Hyphococcus flavus TaxID=1866326 RepID=A0AAF0CGH6_9PROT|nr:AMP-binding protein [Hyphococcus flavus]WDI30672.1 AMP-binding protein [Hyphococcus flavus]
MKKPLTAHQDTFVRENLPESSLLPDFLFEIPELQFPEKLNASVLLDQAVASGNGAKDAVLWESGRWSYNELLAQVSRVADFLSTRMNFVPGNRVLIHGPNSPMLLAIWWGVLRAGGVAVTTMPLLRATELETIIDKAEISHAFIDARLEDVFDAAANSSAFMHQKQRFNDGILERKLEAAKDFVEPVATAGDDPALIAFTSGTTGMPKGCVHFHRDVLAMAETFSRRIVQPKADDVFCGTPPFAFTFGLGASVVFPAACGAATALTSGSGVEPLLDAIERHHVTTLFTAPTAYRGMMSLPATHFKSLHTCVSAGEHLPQATSDGWHELTGIRPIDGIGATEMIHIFISAAGGDIKPGSTGRAVPGYQAQIVDDDMNPVPHGEVGRLAVRGPTGCRYLADERQANYVKDGWNLTGDLFHQDKDGYFWYVSRADDMIISSGYNIAAPEVENALLSHPDVVETAVIGIQDVERGQICKAFVVLDTKKEASEEKKLELQAHVKETIAPYKYPREIEFVAELPKTHTGKLQRYKLKN